MPRALPTGNGHPFMVFHCNFNVETSMTRFVVHIGPHKTGTTYLQEGFVRLRSELDDRGINYPTWWGSLAHGALLERLLNPPDAELESQFAQLRAGDHGIVLISAEGLCGLQRQSVSYLRQLMGDADVRIVFYIRAWAELLASIWQEIVKEGAASTLPEFLYGRLAEPRTDMAINVGAGLGNYIDCFGQDALAVVSYERVVAERLDLFSHFAGTFLGWENAPPLGLGRINASLPAVDIETIRVLNAIEAHRSNRSPSPRHARALAENYLRLKEGFAASPLAEALNAHVRTLCIDEAAPSLQTLHEELFAKFERNLVAPRPARLLFEPRRVDVAYVHPDYLARPGVVDALHDIHRQLTTGHDDAGLVVGEQKRLVVTMAAPLPAPTDGRPIALLGAVPNAAAAPERLVVNFLRGGNSDAFLIDGWSAAESEYRWSAAPEANLHLPLPQPWPPGDYLVSALLRPFFLAERLPTQAMEVEANGTRLGEVRLGRPTLLRFVLPATLVAEGAGAVRLRLRFPDAARPIDLDPRSRDNRLLGFAFERLSLAGPLAPLPPSAPIAALAPTPAVPPAELRDLMLRFESLGENCEFGLVQRRCGAEPLGLLRFSSTPLAPLLEALRARFVGLGEFDALELELGHDGSEYMVHDRRYGFRYHAWMKLGDQPAADILERERRRVPLLVRKLVEDLTDGVKLFVYHGMLPIAQAEALDLAAAVRSYGPGALLWVERADQHHAPGTVIEVAPGLLKGHMDRFAPGENAHDLSVACWVEVCRNALQMAASTAAAQVSA
jgi:hypothetical protein